MTQLEFNDDVAARLDLLYSSRDVLRRRQLVRAALAAKPGERVLDVGCGPGFFVTELLDEVGADGSIVGVDASAQMLAIAARRCDGRPNVRFELADAASLPVDDASFDAALSVQVLEYVADIPAALAELHRAVRPGGRVVIWDVDWATVSWYSHDPQRMQRVLRAWDAHLTHPSLPQTLAAQLRSAGFGDVRTEGHSFTSLECTPDTYAGAIIPLIEDYVAGREDVSPSEVSTWAAEQRELGAHGEFFFACMQFCISGVRRS
jgi:ubiquinone/menaquinone biosynthesis C-methylase UbiE